MKRFVKWSLVPAILLASLLIATPESKAGGFSLSFGGGSPFGYGSYYGGSPYGYGGYGGYGSYYGGYGAGYGGYGGGFGGYGGHHHHHHRCW